VLQAVTQSVQPLAHFPLSISMPQRTLAAGTRLGAVCRSCRLRDLDQAHAGSHDAQQDRLRRCLQETAASQDVDFGGWMEGDLLSCVMA
jgi:hypothetical protein